MSQNTLIVIVGPTAIGKTELAIKVAQRFTTEIISADSRQFYREMAIGTAKPIADELAAAKHHFVNSHSITDDFTVGDFEDAGLKVLEDIFSRKQSAVLVGGSGLFIKAITEGFDDLPKAEPGVREMLNKTFQEGGIEPLQQQLKELDSLYYNEVDIHNPQRLIRALEVCLSTGLPFSSFRKQETKARNFTTVKIGLNTDRKELYNRINRRVDKMIEAGLVEEVKELFEYRNLNALNTVGYSEIVDHLEGRISLAQAIENIKQNTRRFAKRQLTWFRRDTEIQWFEPGEFEKVIAYIEEKAGPL